MSDFVNTIRARGLEELTNKLDTNKLEDMARLQRTDLPQFDLFELPYASFGDSQELKAFLAQKSSEGYVFCVRAIPTKEGKKKGYSRQPKKGLKNFDEAKFFLSHLIKEGEEELWDVGITTMAIQPYGGVIISSPGFRGSIRAEIATQLDKLTAGEENPLATYVRDMGKYKGRWEKAENRSAMYWLRKAIKTIGLRTGYFEFVVSQRNGKTEIKFVDYKTNPEYLK